MNSSDFWKNKRVLVTNPTSFLGSWLCLSLLHLEAQVFGFGEASKSSPCLFDIENLAEKIGMNFGDLRDLNAAREVLNFAQADIVIHLGESGFLHDVSRDSLELISKSVMGTATLMELLRETASVRAVVVVSSDKVYAKDPQIVSFSELDKIGARDLLSTSKLCSELVALSYRSSYFSPEKYNKHKVAVATARIGQAIGGGDFTQGTLIPQVLQAQVSGSQLELRNPQSERPWLHILEQVDGLMSLAQTLFDRGPKISETYNIAAVESASVQIVVQKIRQMYRNELGDERILNNSRISRHAGLSVEKARAELSWIPQLSLDQSLELTVSWYRNFYETQDSEISSKQIRQFFLY